MPGPQLKREWSPWPELSFVSRNLRDLSKGVICDDVSEFDSCHPSHPVRSPPPTREGLPKTATAQRHSQGNPAGSNRANARENGQIGRSTTRSGCPRVPVAVRTSRLSSREEGKAIIFTPVRESSGESPAKIPAAGPARTPRRARRQLQVIIYLCSGGAAFVTGANIAINGGQHMQ
jgi:hypothetical protein